MYVKMDSTFDSKNHHHFLSNDIRSPLQSADPLLNVNMIQAAPCPQPHNPSVQTPSGPAVVRPGFNRAPSNSLSSRRPELRLRLTNEEQNTFTSAVQAARDNLVSDATNLPKSTNMGMGKHGPPQHAIKPVESSSDILKTSPSTTKAAMSNVTRMKPAEAWPIPQPVADEERPQALTEHQQAIRAHDSQAHSWEESETFERKSSASRSPESPKNIKAPSKAVFLRAIPCMYTANVANATSFYKDILGFSIIGKPDSSYASLMRSPDNASAAGMGNVHSASRGISNAKQVPADAVQIYIRIAPMGDDGERVKPPATTLWILVNDVDEVYAELQAKWAKFQPRTDEYFPMHSFGDAKIVAKPQNKAWGNRELHIIDGDENKIIFFRQLR